MLICIPTTLGKSSLHGSCDMTFLMFHVITLLQSVTSFWESASRITKHVSKSMTDCYCKVRLVCKVSQSVIKIVSDITKCDSYYKFRRNRWDAALITLFMEQAKIVFFYIQWELVFWERFLDLNQFVTNGI